MIAVFHPPTGTDIELTPGQLALCGGVFLVVVVVVVYEAVVGVAMGWWWWLNVLMLVQENISYQQRSPDH